MYYKKNHFLCYTCGMLKIEQWNVTFCRPNGFNHVNKFVSNYVLTNISSVVEFERWWFLKSKISGPKSIYSKETIVFLRIWGVPVRQKLGMILENKVVQKLKLEKNVFYKKWSL